MLSFGAPGNLIRFPISLRMKMTGRKPLGPAKIFILPVVRHERTPLVPTPRRTLKKRAKS